MMPLAPVTRTFPLITLLALTACTTFVPGSAQHNIGQSVRFNEEEMVTVGDVMFSEFDYHAKHMAVLTEPLEVTYQGMRIAAPTGYSFVPYQVGGMPGYCSTTNIMYSILGNAAKGACLFDRDNDSRFEIVVPAMVDNFGEKPIVPVAYKLVEISTATQGRKQELLYNGISGQTLNLTYREYTNDMTRPSFQQELTYNLSPAGPTNILFRNARLTVLSATNSSIRFVVHSGVSG